MKLLTFHATPTTEVFRSPAGTVIGCMERTDAGYLVSARGWLHGDVSYCKARAALVAVMVGRGWRL